MTTHLPTKFAYYFHFQIINKPWQFFFHSIKKLLCMFNKKHNYQLNWNHFAQSFFKSVFPFQPSTMLLLQILIDGPTHIRSMLQMMWPLFSTSYLFECNGSERERDGFFSTSDFHEEISYKRKLAELRFESSTFWVYTGT